MRFLAAALSTASGLLLVISSSIAHDLYYRVINPNASEKQRLLLGRAVIGVASTARTSSLAGTATRSTSSGTSGAPG